MENLVVAFLEDVELVGVALILACTGRVDSLMAAFGNLAIVSLEDVELVDVALILDRASRGDRLNLEEICVVVAPFWIVDRDKGCLALPAASVGRPLCLCFEVLSWKDCCLLGYTS